MPGRTYEDMQKIRKWVESALQNKCESPRQVLEFIEQNSDMEKAPSIPTIGQIMKDMGYSPTGVRWKKGK